MSNESPSDELDIVIRNWVLKGNAALLELLPFCKPINDLPIAPSYKRGIMSLSTACWGTSQTIFYLIHGLRLWDAEVLMRSVCEGTIKLGYILEDTSTIEPRCIEYREILPAIAKLRWHARAEAALAASPPGTADHDLRPFRDLLITEEENASLRKKYPREIRNQLERQWSFTSLIEAVSKTGGAYGSAARGLLHGYSLASHIYHMSYEGTDLPLERDTRISERKSSVTKAHAARLVSDCYNLALLRIIVLHRHLNNKDPELFNWKNKHDDFFSELGKAGQAWARIEYGKVSAEGA